MNAENAICSVPGCNAVGCSGVKLETGDWLCMKHSEDMRIIQAEIGVQATVVTALAMVYETAGLSATRLCEEAARLEEMQDRRLLYLKLAGLEGA